MTRTKNYLISLATVIGLLLCVAAGCKGMHVIGEIMHAEYGVSK